MDTLQAIVEHGIAVRQIPLVVIGKWSKGYTTSCPRSICTPIIENGREFVRVERVPENAGYWMTQICRDTSSSMQWDTKKHNLAPTLDESVQLLLASI